MNLFNNILFPVDFSPECDRIAPAVVDLARRLGAKLRLLHVLDLATLFRREWHDYIGLNELPSMRPRAERRIAEFLPELFREIAPVREVIEGEAGRAIAEYAGAHKIDLVTMPTHGHGPFRRLLLGSVTAKVLHDAACPVLTGAHASDPSTIPFAGNFTRLLCAVDLSEDSARIIGWAQRVASAFNSSALVVHAAPASGEPGDEAQKAYNELQARAGINWDLVLVKGPVARGVREAAIEHRADLIVCGRGVIREPFGRLRTSSYAIIRESPCAVLSV
jgi:nucleotide-binding universal stress UspA family protein